MGRKFEGEGFRVHEGKNEMETVIVMSLEQCAVLFCSVLYYTVLYCTVITVLHCTVQYCTVMYYTVLYCTVCNSFFIDDITELHRKKNCTRGLVW